MSEYTVIVRWHTTEGEFVKGRYSRAHTWTFDGGLVVAGSSSPSVVRVPYSDPAAVDPEEAFVAAISSCHMLTFLDLAKQDGLDVASYEDTASGAMTPNERGVPWMSRVVLRPRIVWAGAPPAADRLADLHHRAHLECFISCSVRSEIVVETPAD